MMSSSLPHGLGGDGEQRAIEPLLVDLDDDAEDVDALEPVLARGVRDLLAGDVLHGLAEVEEPGVGTDAREDLHAVGLAWRRHS